MGRVLVQSLAAAALATWCATAPAFQQEPQGVPRVLIDRRLQERAIQLTGIDTRTVTYLDIAGLARHEPLSEFLVLAPPSAADLARRAAAAQNSDRQATSGPDGRLSSPTISTSAVQARPSSLLELTDGQRFSGTLAPPIPGAVSKDSVRWTHPVLGVLDLKLDRVRRVQLNMPAAPTGDQSVVAPAPAAQDDTVILANGDRIEGFVESIGGAGEQMEFGVAGSKGGFRTIDLSVVREIILANPPQPMPARSMLLWLRDGSVIACRGIQSNRLGELTISAAIQDTEASSSESRTGAGQGLVLDDLLAAAFDNDGLVPLATLPPVHQSPEGERRWAQPAVAVDTERSVLGAADIQLPGPMTIDWDLPKGASRFAADAELPRTKWTWGDCELVVAVVSADGSEAEVFRRRINAEQPRTKLAVSLGDPSAPRRLRIRLEPGNYGPVQDQIILHRPLLLIEKDPG